MLRGITKNRGSFPGEGGHDGCGVDLSAWKGFAGL